MVDALGETYTAAGKLQWSSRFPVLRLRHVFNTTSVANAIGNQGSQSFAQVSFAADKPFVAVRAGAGWTMTNVAYSGGTWFVEVFVNAAVGTAITILVFDSSPPPASFGGFETFDASGARNFSLDVKPVRVVGRVTATGAGNGFQGSSSRRYAALMPAIWTRTTSVDTGAAGSQRYSITNYISRCDINDSTGLVQMNQWLYNQYRSANPAALTGVYGVQKLLVVDVTNYF